MLTGKLCAVNSNAPSASESSSESSPTASPLIAQNDGPNPEAERCLPGVVSYVYALRDTQTGARW